MDKNVKSPSVSVLMPVYNAAAYLNQAVDSVLSQTYADFELVILNDGSVDLSEQIILSYSDERIKYYKNEQNEGLIKTLNKGIGLCCGKYIARMDADDISALDRLKKQVDFLEKNPDIVIVGSDATRIDENGKYLRTKIYYCQADLMSTKLFFTNVFAHSSILIKRDIIVEFGYSEDYPIAEDYFLWTQIASKYKVANINEPLIYYRVHSQGISVKKNELQSETIKKICFYHLSRLEIIPTEEELNRHFMLLFKPRCIKLFDIGERQKIVQWNERLLEQNRLLKIYNEVFFEKKLRYRWSLKKQIHILFLKIRG